MILKAFASQLARALPTMRIDEIVGIKTLVDKIEKKHGVSPEEVEYALQHRPHIRCRGEDLYQAWSRTAAGRYLLVCFTFKPSGNAALPITARQMTKKEKAFYARQKKTKN